MILVCARSMELTLSFPLAVIVLFGINLALTLPSTPASAGPFEGATVAVLLFAGIAKAPAVGFAFFYHAIQVVPVTVVGAAVLLMAKRGRERTTARMSVPPIPTTKLGPS
jgi:glycosyltransferase 2 family protein